MKYTTRDIAAVVRGSLIGCGTRTVREVVNDHRLLPARHGMFAALRGTHREGAEFAPAAAAAGAVAVLVEKGAEIRLMHLAERIDLIVVEDVQAALWNLASHHRSRFLGLAIAVTGSCGKTTTRAMLEAILERCLGAGCATRGNQNNLLGTPLTILRLDLEHAYLLAEIGTNAFGEIERLSGLVQPRLGIITGVMRAHLEGFGDVRGVLREKTALARAVPQDGAVVFPSFDPLLSAESSRFGGEAVSFGYADRDLVRIVREQEGAQVEGTFESRGCRVEVRLPIPGVFNLKNAAAALAVAAWLGLDLQVAAAALSTFLPEKMRMETRTIRGVTWLVDAYNANPDSMCTALRTLKSYPGKRKIAILGRMYELGAKSDELHEEVGRLAGELGLDLIVPVDGDGAMSRGARGALGGRGEVAPAADQAAAAETVLAFACPGDVALLKGSRFAAVEKVLARIEEGGK